MEMLALPGAPLQAELVARTDFEPIVVQDMEIELADELPETVPPLTLQLQPALVGVQLLAEAEKVYAWPVCPEPGPETEIAGDGLVLGDTTIEAGATSMCSSAPRRTRRHGSKVPALV